MLNQQLVEQTDIYIESLFAGEDEHLRNVITSLDVNQFPQASVSPVQGKLIQVMALATMPTRILEIGTLGGYSTIWLARALPETGRLISLEFEPERAELARKHMESAGLADKVTVITGKAMDTLNRMISEKEAPFDFIFIDADKPPYTEYFIQALKLSRKGTMIIADNVIRNGKVLDHSSTDDAVKGVQRFNRYLASCSEVSATLLQVVGVKEYDGMAVAVVR